MEFISNGIAGGISQIANTAREFWQNLMYADMSLWQIILDISIVAVVIYFLFSMLKGSRSVSVIVGLSIIGVLFLVSKSLNLVTVGWLLDRFFTILLISIPILFQQEMRMALEKIGNTPFLTGEKNLAVDVMISDIVACCNFLAGRKEGALIVFRHSIPLKEYIETGVKMEALVSKELLISIFHGKGPLHDGAVIVDNGRIAAAACILPTSFDNKERNVGTRHKAAIGLTDHTDASVIVISEERGSISFAKNGHLERDIDAARLQQLLRIVLVPKTKKKIEKQMTYRDQQ
jgi:diadenylate cyclase